MIRQIQNGVFVRRRLVIDDKFVSLIQAVGDQSLQRSGIAFLPIDADVAQFKRKPVTCVDNLAVPDNLVESAEAAVKRIRTIVPGKFVNMAVQFEFAVRNPIGIPSHQCTEKRILSQIAIKIVKPQYDIRELSISVGRFEGDDTPSEIRDSRFSAGRVRQGVQGDGLAGGIGAPSFLISI